MSKRLPNFLFMGAIGFSASFLWSGLSARLGSAAFGMPSGVFSLLVLFLLLEGGLKFLFLQAIAPITHIPIEPERWRSSVQNQLTHYTQQLEQLGFVILTDYTFQAANQNKPSPSTARLFVHPRGSHFPCFFTTTAHPRQKSRRCPYPESISDGSQLARRGF